MKTFLKEALRSLLAIAALFIFLTALIFIAVAIVDKTQTGWYRAIYTLGGIVGIALGIWLLRRANPKDAEGGLLYVILELLNWPR